MNFNKRIFALLIILITTPATTFAMDAGDGPEDTPGKPSSSTPPAVKSNKQSRKKRPCWFYRYEDMLLNLNAFITRRIDPRLRDTNIPITAEKQASLNARLLEIVDTQALPAIVGTHEVKELLDSGAQVETRNHEDLTILMLATRNGLESICELLLNHSALVNARTINGQTALMIATRVSQSLCEMFIEHGAHINAKSSFNETPLMIAAFHGYESICKVLIDNGAQFDAKDTGNNTAFKWAIIGNHKQTIKTLISYSFFNPFVSDDEFLDSRHRIWTSLCVFKRLHPSLPRDVRKLILCSLPELKNDVINSGAFGLTEKQTPFAPLPLVRFLIEQEQLDLEETVATIKAHHLQCITPLICEAIPHAQIPAIRALIHPDHLEQNFGYEIELNIRRRLGLPITWADSVINMIPESCSVQ